MILTSTLNPSSDGVLIDPTRALLRRFTTINASNHTCRIPDAVGDLSATRVLVKLAPRGAVRSFKPFVDSGHRNSVALDQWLPAGEPVGELADSRTEVARGRRDRVTDMACSSLGTWPWSARLLRAFALPGEQACRVEL